MVETKLNIYQRMNKVTEGIKTVAKNLQVSTGKSGSYKAVSEVDIINAVKPLETEFGIYSYPEERTVLESYMIETDKGTYTQKQQFMRIETKYVFVNVDEPSEKVISIAFGDGVDSQDKAPGKAMTYADKYALMKAYKISTGDDPDKYASEPIVNKVDTSMEKEQLAYTKLRTELSSLGVNYREDQAVINWICEKAKIEHQDNTKLTLAEMKRLNTVYRTLKEQKELKISDKELVTF